MGHSALCPATRIFAPQMNRFLHQIVTGTVLSLLVSCANISTPSGGKRDTTPPRLLKAAPADSLKNSRTTRITLEFDEYVNLSDASKEIEVSPLLPVPPTITSANKHVTVKIPDTLLQPNTTYRVSFGKAVRDLHEGNIFPNYVYTFSTGNYFDSAMVGGTVTNAQTGEKDTVGVIAVLYDATENDSAIVRKKPLYRVRPDSRGVYTFKGLPVKPFRLYAIKDDNGNMTYDGGNELIAFCDNLITPADTVTMPVEMRLFGEKTDSTKNTDASEKPKAAKGKARMNNDADTVIRYTLNVDTTNIAQRSFDINDSVTIAFNKIVTVVPEKAHLTYDSAGAAKTVLMAVRSGKDKKSATITANWRKNTAYTLTLDSTFATDSAGRATTAVRYRFKTFTDDDYGKITVHIPAMYVPTGKTNAPEYLLVILADGKPAGQLSIKDSMVTMPQLKPATYTFRIIVDQNRNGIWDTGDLMARKQPERVIPGTANVVLKAKWEHNVDFEAKPANNKKK
jgi:hypothetical protein